VRWICCNECVEQKFSMKVKKWQWI